jgi:3-polyprenyl-4-hydroxybenzoate decarboxylase
VRTIGEHFIEPDWHDRTHLISQDFAKQIGDVIFSSKAGFGVAKVLLIEHDIDISNPEEVVWAFASRAHPSHGEIYFQNEAQNILPVFLDGSEKFSFKTTKVIHNCLLADRFTPEKRPQRFDFHNSWTPEIQEKVLSNWQAYGFR